MANKCRRPAEADAIAEFCRRHGLELAGVIGWSDAVLDADAASVPVLDHPGAEPVAEAVAAAVGRLLDLDDPLPIPEPTAGARA